MKPRKFYTNAKMDSFSQRRYLVPQWGEDGAFTHPVLMIPLDEKTVANLRAKIADAVRPGYQVNADNIAQFALTALGIKAAK